MSHANSMASSQRHMLGENETNAHSSTPFTAATSALSHGQPKGTSRPANLTIPPTEGKDSNVSLTVNFLPSKFSRPVSPGGMYKRKNAKGAKDGGGVIPKVGGGREAFKSGESRMPGENDDDYDGVDNVRATWFGGPAGRKKKLRWNRFKWIMFVMNTIVSRGTLTNLPSFWLIVSLYQAYLIFSRGTHRLLGDVVQHLDGRGCCARGQSH